MDTPIMDRVEDELRDFRPRSQRDFVLLQIAKRFKDEGLLAKYLNVGRAYPKNVLLEAARLAQGRAAETGQPASTFFFDILRKFAEEDST